MIDSSMRRKLTDDVDISTMLTMRRQGMSNKQIASALGVSPTTIYKYIGRKSDAVKVAHMQNRAPGYVIPPQPWEIDKSASVVVEQDDQDKQPRKKPRRDEVHTTAPESESVSFKASETFAIDTSELPPVEEEVEVPNNIVEFEKQDKKVSEMANEKKKHGSLRVVSTRSTLQGNLCKYVVDTDSDSIEIDGGCVLTGLLDKTTLSDLIDELIEIRSMFVY